MDGEIVRMITRAGTPLVKTGDICEKRAAPGARTGGACK
ncbi:MAG: hypothetical protein ACLR5B_05210 [Blautia sp.]